MKTYEKILFKKEAESPLAWRNDKKPKHVLKLYSSLILKKVQDLQ